MSQDFILGCTNRNWSRSADTKTSGIVISDAEIKAAMQGHRRHHRRRRGQPQGQPQYPGQYQRQPAGSTRPDPQKLQLLRSTYQQIKSGHINWLVNADHQNNVWNTPATTYQQAGKLWARQQLQQQQLPIRSDPTTYSQWQQPLGWFQTQTQAALNSAAGQMAASITATQPPAGTPYTPPPYTSPVPASQFAPAPTPVPAGPANVYYPAPGDGSYDDALDNQSGRSGLRGWPSPLLMHGDSFVGDESRAEGENSISCGDALPHNEYRALVMKRAIKAAGGQAPSTKQLFAAKKAVDNALGNAGVAICIPGAGPRRRTV